MSDRNNRDRRESGKSDVNVRYVGRQSDETQGSTTEDKMVKMDRASTDAARGECEQIQIDS
jgi:hypothetical protein